MLLFKLVQIVQMLGYQSLPILVDLPQKSGDNYIYNTKVDPKGGYPDVTKKIIENSNPFDQNDVSIGQHVKYQVTSDVTKVFN